MLFWLIFFFCRVCAVWSLLGIKVCGSALLLKMPWYINQYATPGQAFSFPYPLSSPLSSNGLPTNYPLTIRPPYPPQYSPYHPQPLSYPSPVRNRRQASGNPYLGSPKPLGLFIENKEPSLFKEALHVLEKEPPDTLPNPSNSSTPPTDRFSPNLPSLDTKRTAAHIKLDKDFQNSSSISTAFDNEKGLFSEKVKEHLLKVFEKYVDLMRSKKKLYNRNLLSNHDLNFYSAFPNNKIHEWQNEMISLQRFLEKHNIQVGQCPQEETES